MKRQKKRPAQKPIKPSSRFVGRLNEGDERTAAGSFDVWEFLPFWMRQDWVAAFFLAAVTFLAYQPVWHAGFIWDDDDFLTNNPVIQNAHGLRQIWLTTSTPDYFPMTSSSLWLEWRIWANHPLGYHLVNVLLHACNAALLWRVLQRLKIPGALLAAALFALHPVNVESVAWITERKNTLAMLFYLTTILFWLKFADSGRSRWHWLSLGAFALALLSKTAVAPWPLVLLGLIGWRRGRVGWKDLWQAAPFFAMAGVLALVTIWFQYNRSISHDVIRTDGFWSRLAGAGWAVWFYLYKAVLPLNLVFVYPRWQIDAARALSYLPLALLAAAFFLCWRQRQHWGKGWFSALTYFVVMLLPVLGFLNIYFMRYSLVADHWEYFAIIGPIALTGYLMVRTPVLAGVLLLALGTMTWKQCGMYASDETLWQTTLRQRPDAWMAHNNLGNILDQKGMVEEAISHYQEALRYNPDFPEALNDLGNALGQTGRMEEAISYYRKAIEIKPAYADACYNLALIYHRQGQIAEAIPLYQKALAIKPGDADIHNNLGAGLLQLGKVDEAIAHFRKALAINPDLLQARKNLDEALQLPANSGQPIVR
jgi:tetratricopeptide (TPR) repeat protein